MGATLPTTHTIPQLKPQAYHPANSDITKKVRPSQAGLSANQTNNHYQLMML